ncbi:MAG TPA: sodium:proton antiporter, partial [Actinobacteria bacterium]|nr:sodium:proton antiporter [Actinomycetes bacterium]HEX21659.1 sodium:proton antiporter [Actinomycetota bacterium]
MTETYKRLVFPTLALLLWAIADFLGGSGFIAAFVGGLVTARVFGKIEEDFTTFIESEGQLIILAVFFIFGAVIVSKASDITAATVAYAILSLTIIRMIPVAGALAGKHLHYQ